MKHRVFLKDTSTGEERMVEENEGPYIGTWRETWWTDGNGGCDCNRLTWYDRAVGIEMTDDEDVYRCGTGRFTLRVEEITP